MPDEQRTTPQENADDEQRKPTLIPNFQTVVDQNWEVRKAAPPRVATEKTPFFASNEKPRANFADEIEQTLDRRSEPVEPRSAVIESESIFINDEKSSERERKCSDRSESLNLVDSPEKEDEELQNDKKHSSSEDGDKRVHGTSPMRKKPVTIHLQHLLGNHTSSADHKATSPGPSTTYVDDDESDDFELMRQRSCPNPR